MIQPDDQELTDCAACGARVAPSISRTFAALALALLAGACASGSDLPAGWQGARPLAVAQSACTAVTPSAPRLQLAPTADGGLIGRLETTALRCGKPACGYLMEGGDTSQILIQPCEMHPGSVDKCACTTEVTFTLAPSAERRTVELWWRPDFYGQQGPNEPTLVARQPATGPAPVGCEPACLLLSSRPRETIAANEIPPLAPLVSGNTAFALKLYRALRPRTANLFFSPYSLSVALAMTWAGARSETARQMAAALELPPPPTDVHRTFNALDQELARRADEPRSDGNQAADPFRLEMASSLWGRRDVPFLPGFLDLLAANYGAGLRVLDLAGNDESARMTINDWARQKTAGRITDLLPMGAVQGDTVLVLTNAIYFRASWQTPFDETATAPAPFHRLDGSTQDVPTMRLTAVLRQASTPDYDAVSLPYAGGKLSMLVAAARPGRFDALDGPLAPDTLAAVESALRPANVALRFPKLSFSAAFSLAEELAALGMPLAFSDGADFSGMNGAGGLKLTDVVHKAFISVDEKGTEAAAASGVVVGPTSLPPPPIDLWIDRPFIFVVRDEPTRTILFLGRFADPPR